MITDLEKEGVISRENGHKLHVPNLEVLASYIELYRFKRIVFYKIFNHVVIIRKSANKKSIGK